MRKTVIVLALVVLVAAGAAAYFLFVPGATDVLRSRQVIKDQAKIQKIAVGYVGFPYKDDYQMSRINGYVDNLGSAKLSRVVFEIRLLDAKGNRVERVTYTVLDVPAKSRKSFDANAGAISGSRNAEAKITEIEVVR